MITKKTSELTLKERRRRARALRFVHVYRDENDDTQMVRTRTIRTSIMYYDHLIQDRLSGVWFRVLDLNTLNG